MLPDFPADRLHVIEVWTPGGNWSSYPPHKHEHDHDGESELEETYYYRLRDPRIGWGVQRVYSPERDFDLVQTVRDGDLLLIPWGYHTTVAAHGHDLYYLNVLAGPAPKRTLQAFQDPCLASPPRTPGRMPASTPAFPSSRATRTDPSPHALRRGRNDHDQLPPPPPDSRSGRRLSTSSPLSTSNVTARRAPFFGGAIGIFGHGNVAGVGQALLQYRKEFRLYQAPQRAGHGAHGHRLREDAQPARRPRLHHLDRTRARPT